VEILETAFAAESVAVIAFGITALLYGKPQYLSHGSEYLAHFACRDFIRPRLRVDSRLPEDLVRIDVANAGNGSLIEQGGFDRPAFFAPQDL
jgi:hypothetical protein